MHAWFFTTPNPAITSAATNLISPYHVVVPQCWHQPLLENTSCAGSAVGGAVRSSAKTALPANTIPADWHSRRIQSQCCIHPHCCVRLAARAPVLLAVQSSASRCGWYARKGGLQAIRNHIQMQQQLCVSQLQAKCRMPRIAEAVAAAAIAEAIIVAGAAVASYTSSNSDYQTIKYTSSRACTTVNCCAMPLLLLLLPLHNRVTAYCLDQSLQTSSHITLAVLLP